MFSKQSSWHTLDLIIVNWDSDADADADGHVFFYFCSLTGKIIIESLMFR